MNHPFDSVFTFGVTGHRDLVTEDISVYRSAIFEQLKEIKSKLPDTPVELISGMAVGADQLVAEIALELNFRVTALLPMPIESYRLDFSEDEWLRLNALLETPGVTTRVCDHANQFSSEELKNQTLRNQCYAEMGNELIECSILLLALWDGNLTIEQGGTTDVLLRYLGCPGYSEEQPPRPIHLSLKEFKEQPESSGKFALWLPVNRSQKSTVTNDGHQIRVITRGLSNQQLLYSNELSIQFHRQLEQFNEYNVQYQRAYEDYQPGYDNHLLKPSVESLVENAELKAMDDAFVKADNVAIYNQKKSDFQFKLFGYMAALMGISFLVYAKVVAAKVLIITYALLFLSGYIIFKVTHKKHWFTHHLSSRIAAETLRVKFFLALAGVKQRLDTEELFKLSGLHNFEGFNWILWLIKPLNQTVQKTISRDEQCVALVCEEWVQDQAQYFQKKAGQLHHEHHKLERIKQVLLLGSFIASLLLIFFKESLVSTIIAGDFSTKSLLVLLMGLLPLLLGIWEIYQGKLAVKELQWQYKNQALLFNAYLSHLNQSDDVEEKREILFDLAKRSLMENYLWSIHRYHREHEPPAAG